MCKRMKQQIQFKLASEWYQYVNMIKQDIDKTHHIRQDGGKFKLANLN